MTSIRANHQENKFEKCKDEPLTQYGSRENNIGIEECYIIHQKNREILQKNREIYQEKEKLCGDIVCYLAINSETGQHL